MNTNKLDYNLTDEELQNAIYHKYIDNKGNITTTYSYEDDTQLLLSIWNKYKSTNPTKSNANDNLIKFHLKETDKDIYLSEEESYNYLPEDIDTTDLYSKQELVSYLNWRKKEDESIVSTKDKLKCLEIDIKERSKGRFAHWDCLATSANTETIYLEFKNRPEIDSDKYDSFFMDAAKYKALLDLYLTTGKEIYIIYVYKDKRIRVFNFSKNRELYREIKEIEVKDNVYSDRRRKKVYIYYPNELSILL